MSDNPINSLREIMQDMAADAARHNRVLMMPPPQYKILLKETRPALFALYQAGWKAGYTVNGIPA